MDRLSNRHFQQGSQGESASKRPTLLAAAQEVGAYTYYGCTCFGYTYSLAVQAGLDAQTVTAFLDSDELHDEVWRSYP